MATTKRIILFIVEGPTDADTLNPILKKIFNDSTLRFYIVHGDITTSPGITSRNAVTRINECLKKEKEKYRFKYSDVIWIVHLIDTDGAFIPDDRVVYEDTARIIYDSDIVKTRDVDYIQRINRTKREVAARLRSTGAVQSIPYEIYFMSRNLEHVFHNNAGDLSDEEKVELADSFAETYEIDIEGFKKFIAESDFSVKGNYNDTWAFIFSGTNSLHRHSNLHLMLKDNPRGE